MPLPPRKRRKPWRWLWCGLLATLGLLLLDYWAYPNWTGVGGHSLNHAENGLWLHHSWYTASRGDAEVAALACRLQDLQIRYAYFHLRSATPDGSLRFRLPEHARRLVASMHRTAPGIRVIAWVYIGNSRGTGAVDLANSKTRYSLSRLASWLTDDCGFDGVQWDYEICANGESGFLRLLGETRAVLVPGKILSVASPLWSPLPLWGHGWSDSYFSAVAQACDQIAVMVYDSGLYSPRAYVWLMHQQVRHVTSAVVRANPRCRVLIGLPTYDEGGWSHDPHAENLRLALKGVREGLADRDSAPGVFAGVAPFADYTTDSAEWQTYRDLWLR